MQLAEKERDFLRQHHAAAMITLKTDGMPHAVRVGVVLVDGTLWSSGTRDRVRTRNLQRDPRAVLFVFEQGFAALTLETRVRILDGPDVPAQSVRLFHEMQRGQQPHPSGENLMWYGNELTPSEFESAMRAEGRVIYEFDVQRAYGLLQGR
jgi:PPOX class probable F420-dependent enzyme